MYVFYSKTTRDKLKRSVSFDVFISLHAVQVLTAQCIRLEKVLHIFPVKLIAFSTQSIMLFFYPFTVYFPVPKIFFSNSGHESRQ